MTTYNIHIPADLLAGLLYTYFRGCEAVRNVERSVFNDLRKGREERVALRMASFCSACFCVGFVQGVWNIFFRFGGLLRWVLFCNGANSRSGPADSRTATEGKWTIKFNRSIHQSNALTRLIFPNENLTLQRDFQTFPFLSRHCSKWIVLIIIVIFIFHVPRPLPKEEKILIEFGHAHAINQATNRNTKRTGPRWPSKNDPTALMPSTDFSTKPPNKFWNQKLKMSWKLEEKIEEKKDLTVEKFHSQLSGFVAAADELSRAMRLPVVPPGTDGEEDARLARWGPSYESRWRLNGGFCDEDEFWVAIFTAVISLRPPRKWRFRSECLNSIERTDYVWLHSQKKCQEKSKNNEKITAQTNLPKNTNGNICCSYYETVKKEINRFFCETTLKGWATSTTDCCSNLGHAH